MKETIPLDSQKYWNAAADVELKQIRRQENRKAASLFFNVGIAVAAFGGAAYIAAQGTFDDTTLTGIVNGAGGAISGIADNIKNAYWRL